METKSPSTEGELSPIEKVPIEIFAIIFTLANESSSNSYAVGLETPDSISRVNSHWRHISLSLPSLWGDINITAACPLAYSLSHTTLWLERSQDYPLTIFIDFEESVAANENAVIPDLRVLEQVCALLTPHVDRWNTITVKVSQHAFLHPFEMFLAGQPARVKELAFLVSKDIIAKRWRYTLQKAFLAQKPIVAADMSLMSSVLKEIEDSQSKMNTHVLVNSKVDIVLRHIAAKNPEDIPLNDEFKFHSRVLALVDIFIVTRDARRLQVAATRELAINQS